MPKLNCRSVRVAVTGGLIALAAAASATAFQALPPGAQVNDDPVAGISYRPDFVGII